VTVALWYASTSVAWMTGSRRRSQWRIRMDMRETESLGVLLSADEPSGRVGPLLLVLALEV
jgi:hypothetical protein